MLGRASVQLLERLQLAFESCILSNSSSISFSIAEPLAALSMPTGLHRVQTTPTVRPRSRLGNVEVEYRAVRARDAATKAQHGRPLSRVVVHREDQAAQQRAPVDAVSHVAVAPEAQRTTCHSHDQVLLVVQVPARRASRALWRLSSRRGSYAGTHRRAGCSRSEDRLAEGT